MNTIILRLLRKDALGWWHHKKLREWGQIDKARQNERQSIRSAVQQLRLTPDAHYHASYCVQFHKQSVPLGKGVNTVVVSDSQTVSVAGIHPGEWEAFHLRHGWSKCISFNHDSYYKEFYDEAGKRIKERRF